MDRLKATLLYIFCWHAYCVRAGLNAGEIAEYYSQQITINEMTTCTQDNLLSEVFSNSLRPGLPVKLVYADYIQQVYGNHKASIGMRYGCKLDSIFFQCDTLSVCKGTGQQSVCTCDPSPARKFSSCSCRGKCRVNTDGNKRYWNWEAPFGVSIPDWNVCDCNDGWFGERCQFEKSKVSMADLHRDSDWVKHFPFLPWYSNGVIADYFMDEAREYDARSVRAQELDRFIGIASEVYRGSHSARTIWGYDDLPHSCPRGMTMYGIGTANVQYLAQDIGETNHPRRDFLFCGCIPSSNSVVDDGCSGHGKCVGVTDTVWYDNEWTRPGQNPTQRSPPIPSMPTFGFPNMQVFRNIFGTRFKDVGTLLPSKWSRCRCQKDYQGLYCEHDAAPKSRCGNGVTSYGERFGIEGCDCNDGNAVVGKPVRRTGRECRAGDSCNLALQSFRDMCILDKDKSECGNNNKGLYNAYVVGEFKDRISPTSAPYQAARQKLTDAYICECRNDDVENKDFKWPANATQAANTILQYIGRGCKDSCRSKMCNNHGDCRFIRRNATQYIVPVSTPFPFTVPFSNFNEANLSPSASDWVYDSTGCNCDAGYEGVYCTSNSAVGLGECQGFISNSNTSFSCRDRCTWPIGVDKTGWKREVVYNEDFDGCEARCPKWLKCDYTDMGCVPSGLECGGYGRGFCGGVNTVDYQRKCQCLDGYSEYDCGRVSCPRIAGVLVCGGSTRGWCDETKNTCVCKPGMYGDACQFNIPTEENQCARSAQSVYNGPVLL